MVGEGRCRLLDLVPTHGPPAGAGGAQARVMDDDDDDD
eukprot:gene8190-86_t